MHWIPIQFTALFDIKGQKGVKKLVPLPADHVYWATFKKSLENEKWPQWQMISFSEGPSVPGRKMAKKSVLRGANEALIDLDQKLPKIVCYGVPTKL